MKKIQNRGIQQIVILDKIKEEEQIVDQDIAEVVEGTMKEMIIKEVVVDIAIVREEIENGKEDLILTKEERKDL